MTTIENLLDITKIPGVHRNHGDAAEKAKASTFTNY